ncbi:ABC transporter ATP-binding protein [Magnetospirillum aberrantis]|uniref:ABC transporter ATP-binding protein n=1 Tax=Magnetospirillum aberrantis SpK TaxID=908842 RepID=A0A7C9QTQ7_9PROT|nr:ABC transporter ATP-binding protein [Magnetospirillum aberrantis]NFV80443.1 ABC transporter ATP-binding protein [Magnetospirillum aberrantis SpK]
MTEGLKIEGLSHFYGTRAVVRDVSLHVAPGELVCLLGPSGCGKTTTLRLAAGLETARHGRVVLNNRIVSGDGRHVPPEGRHVGFLFQDYALFPHLDVRANVEFGIRHRPPPERHARALDMLEQVGMADYAKSWPHQLSGGQQQRVALARALAPAPGLMLLDEPFSGLDRRLRDQIRDETLGVLKRNRVATMMVTHDPEEAMAMADRIAIMRDGRVVQMGRPATLYDAPADAFVAAFFGEVNTLAAIVRDQNVDTPLGRFPATGTPDGAVVQVVVRPEAITPHPSADGVAMVRAVRPLGAVTQVLLELPQPDGSPLDLRCRLSGAGIPAEGERVAISIDRALVFAPPLTG